MLRITEKHTGKMEGMQSLSTSVLMNANCTARKAIKGSICSKCYADRMTKAYKGLEAKLAENTKVLTETYLQPNEIPAINAQIFRFEAFGDINNVTQVENYFNICKANKRTTFALWTKNPLIIRDALKQCHKPNNIIIIYSSPMIDKPVNIDALRKLFPFIDKVFSVYTKEYAKENNININCGNRKCNECRRCYSKRTADTVNELLK